MKCLNISHILFPGAKKTSPAEHFISYFSPRHLITPKQIYYFFYQSCQLVELFFHLVGKKKKKKKVEKKQINAGLSSETLLGLAGHHLSSVFHNHSASLEPSMGFFNCPSAGERV